MITWRNKLKLYKKINSQFESDALVDGSYNASIAVKSDANFNNLPESVTTTGNASLDSTIQEAIKGGKTQLEEKLRLRAQHLQRQLLIAPILLVLLHLQVITRLEQLLLVVVRPHQILLERKMDQLTQVQLVHWCDWRNYWWLSCSFNSCNTRNHKL